MSSAPSPDSASPHSAPVASGGESSATLDPVWQHVLAHWEDEAAHDAFLQLSQSRKELAEAARRYRSVQTDPTKTALVEKKLAQITVLALSSLEASRSERSGSRIPKIFLGFFVCALLALLFFGLYQILSWS